MGFKEKIDGMAAGFKGLGKAIRVAVPILLVIIVLTGSIYKLDTGWNAVVMRFGKMLKLETQSGFHFKLPIFDSIEKINLAQIHKLEYGYRTTVEGTDRTEPQYEDYPDEAMVIVDAKSNNSSVVLINLVVRYRVDKPADYLFKVDDLTGTIRLALEDVVRNTIQVYTLNEALTNKAIIDDAITPELQKRMNEYEAGIKIVEVKTQNTMLMPSVNAAYEAVEEANQYKNGKIQEAIKKRNTIIPQAEGEYTQLIESAKGYRAEVIAKAKANVAEYEALYQEYKKNPDIVKERYYVDAMKEFVKNNEIVIDMTEGKGIYKFYNMGSENAVKQQVIEGEGR